MSKSQQKPEGYEAKIDTVDTANVSQQEEIMSQRLNEGYRYVGEVQLPGGRSLIRWMRAGKARSIQG